MMNELIGKEMTSLELIRIMNVEGYYEDEGYYEEDFEEGDGGVIKFTDEEVDIDIEFEVTKIIDPEYGIYNLRIMEIEEEELWIEEE